MDKKDKIFVAGHRGLVGSALLRALQNKGYSNILTRRREELDLTNQALVNAFIEHERPGYMFIAAAKVGGIHANNTYRADFIYQNLVIQTNLIEAARRYGVKRLLFLGSSCIYPRHCQQPMKEEYLLQGYLEPTNEPYALAKIAGIKMCESYNYQYKTDFTSVIPTNLYGPEDNFDLQNSHVLPSVMRKAHEAKVNKLKSIVVWGTGKAKREFLYVDDMADACVFIMQKIGYTQMLNIGSGREISIRDMTKLICKIVGFKGEIIFDLSMPDGVTRKLLDTTTLNLLGWKPRIDLEQGLQQTYDWYVQHSA